MKRDIRFDQVLASFSRRLCVGSFLASSLLLAACGRDTQVYSDPAPPAAASTVTVIDGTNTLPQGFYDQSVNAATVDLALDGSTSTSNAIRLVTKPELNAAGSFNGAGTGNLALLGLANYDSATLASLQPITFDGEYYAVGSSYLSLKLIADLNCDQTNIRVLVANGPALASGATAITGSTYSHMDAGFDEPVWQVTGSSIVDSSSNVIVPSVSSGTVTTLMAFLTAYPNACVTNTASGDASLPYGLPTAGILFSLGSPNTTDLNGAFINQITVGSDDYNATQWGHQ